MGEAGRKPGLIFLECSIEIIPPEIRSHPKVVKTARRYSTKPELMLLDKSIHYQAMRRLEKRWKRGRPDILHACLLVLSDSPLRSRGSINVYFQSLDGRVFEISPATRLPKTYERFKGVIASVLAREKIVSEDGALLIAKTADSLPEFLSKTGYELALLWEKGEPVETEELARIVAEEGLLLGVGCFPHGDFEEETLRLARKRYSIACGTNLTAWGATFRVLSSLEKIMLKDCRV